MNLTDNETAALAALRAHVEYESKEGWGMVYIDNAGQGHAFEGTLGSLEKKGLYIPQDDEFAGDWGQVKLGV